MDTKLLLKEGNSLCRLNSQASIADCTYENIHRDIIYTIEEKLREREVK